MIRNIARHCNEEPKGKSYKYKISYTSGSTGYGWEDACDTIDEVNEVISEIYKESSAMVTVFDNVFGEFVFFKRALSAPEMDMLHASKRDLRTTTREVKH